MFRSSLIVVSVFVTGGYARVPSTGGLARSMHHHTPDVRELLASARGVAPTVCLLAADGVASTGRWGGGGGGGFWDAPAMSIGAEVRMRVREMLRARLDAALSSKDPELRSRAVRMLAGSSSSWPQPRPRPRPRPMP